MRNYFAFIIEKDRKGLKILLEKSILYSPFVARLFFYFRFNCKGRTNFGIQVFLEIKKKSRLIGTEHNLDEISSTGGEKHFFLLNAVENPDSNRSYIPRILFDSCFSPRCCVASWNYFRKTGLLWKRRLKDEMTMDREWHDSRRSHVAALLSTQLA